MKRYLIIGGYIISQNDGDTHYINSHTLMRLYSLSMEKCYLAEEHDKIYIDQIIRYEKDIEILRPKYDGNYKLKDPNNPLNKKGIKE